MLAFLIQKREKAGLSEYEVAARLKRWQSYVARVESGQRRLDLMELLDFAEALRFDIRELVRQYRKFRNNLAPSPSGLRFNLAAVA